MRPSPINPHVVDLGLLVANALWVVVAAIDHTDMLLPSIQSREGEKRTLTVALMLVSQAIKLQQTRRRVIERNKRIEMEVQERRMQKASVEEESHVKSAMDQDHRCGVSWRFQGPVWWAAWLANSTRSRVWFG